MEAKEKDNSLKLEFLQMYEILRYVPLIQMIYIWYKLIKPKYFSYCALQANDQCLQFQNDIQINMTWSVFLLLVICVLKFCGGQEDQEIPQGRWQDNIRPKLFAQLSSRDYQSFSGILLNDPSNEQNASSRGNRKYPT